MAANDPVNDGVAASDRLSLTSLFESLTPKQHEVFELVADNWTSKEIAARLGVTQSAINQRIEAVRLRAGALPRAQIARAYRQFQSERAAALASLSGHGVEPMPVARPYDPQSQLSNLGLPGRAMAKGSVVSTGWLNRIAAMALIAGGLMVVAMGGLAVAQVLTTGL